MSQLAKQAVRTARHSQAFFSLTLSMLANPTSSTRLSLLSMKQGVVIVDPHTSVRQMLAGELSRTGEFEIVADVSDGASGFRNCPKDRLALVIFELNLPELCGLELLKRLKAKATSARALIYSGASCEERIRAALQGEPDGFVHKSDPLEMLIEAAHTISRGGIYISGTVAPFRRGIGQNGSAPRLTTREGEILQLIAESYSSKQIAARLNLSAKTVENHRSNLMAKLNVHDIAALTRIAARRGLIEV